MKGKFRFPDNYIQDYREKIGKDIRTLREGKSLSQDGLAEIMEVQRSTISKIETGKFAITVDYLVKFARYLDYYIAFINKDK